LVVDERFLRQKAVFPFAKNNVIALRKQYYRKEETVLLQSATYCAISIAYFLISATYFRIRVHLKAGRNCIRLYFCYF